MKHKFFLFKLFALSLLLSGCSTKQYKPETTSAPENQNEKIIFTKGKIILSVISDTDPSQTYSLYLPESYSDSVKFPVLIFFDPHADGGVPLNLYKSLADKFGYVLMGSNNSKNGLQFDQTSVIANNLIREASSRFSTDMKRISLAGFSGGAKVALTAASGYPDLLAVIYCGAAISFENTAQLPPALGFAGLRDMNYAEVGNSSRELFEKRIFHSLIEWNGKHEWPDLSVFEDAFFWCHFQSMRNKSIAIDQKMIYLFTDKINKSLQVHSTYITQCNLCTKALSFLHDLTDVSAYHRRLESISRSDLFKTEMQTRQNLLQLETTMKDNYLQCFDSKDILWWQQEIARMKSGKGEQELMYQRLLGYLSLAAYSYSSKAIEQNNFSSAQQYLGIYKLADPENSEQPFLEACLFARDGNQEKALTSLSEAIKLGLKDRRKIEAEESFNTLRPSAEFNRLLNSL